MMRLHARECCPSLGAGKGMIETVSFLESLEGPALATPPSQSSGF